MPRTDRATITRREERTAASYINFASTSLASLRLLSAARERALRDTLTGAFNRAFLSEHLGKQLALARRKGEHVSLMMLDLDHFKRLNDTYGHQLGDRALAAFAAAIHRSVRSSDSVVRYGGEEFLVVMPDTDLAPAVGVAERVRTTVAEISLSNGTELLGGLLRVSIGVAAFPQHGDAETVLIGAADAALYRAKSSGRDRVVAAMLPETTAAASHDAAHPRRA